MYFIEKEDYFEEFFTDIGSLLEDLGQSGFHTVHDSTLQDLKEKGETAAQCGMQHLSGLLLALQQELFLNRHRIRSINPESENSSIYQDEPDARCAKYYTELIRYIDLGKEKTAYDKGKNYYANSAT